MSPTGPRLLVPGDSQSLPGFSVSVYPARIVSTDSGWEELMNKRVWASHFLGLSHSRRLASPPRGRAVLGAASLGASQPPDSLAAERPGQLTQVVPLCSWQRRHHGGRGGGGKLNTSIFQVPLPRNEVGWEMPLTVLNVTDDTLQEGPSPCPLQTRPSVFILAFSQPQSSAG